MDCVVLPSRHRALHGRSSLPMRWLAGLLGRTRKDDDCAVFRLLDEAVNRFGPI